MASGAAVAGGVSCPLCGWSGARFAPMGARQRPNARCPECDALERHRAMFLYLRDETPVLTQPVRLLHFAPEPALRRALARPNVEYVSTDLEMEDVSLRMDIHDLLFRDASFDCVICSHVLEHVADDRAALREIARVLRPEGFALILVPVLAGAGPRTLEDSSITTPEGRRRAFGQEDHVRLYGSDFSERAREAGLRVEEVRMAGRVGAAQARRFGLDPGESIFVCRPGATPERRPPAAAAADAGLAFERRIAARDAMARPGRLEHYFRVGLEGLRLVQDALAAAGAPPPAAILDLPSGYGRVLRMLRAGFPGARITACDLDQAAVDFCVEALGADGARSEADLARLDLDGRYGLVWCGSLLTHLPRGQVRAALAALERHLDAGGALVFTTHGARIAELLRSGEASPAIAAEARELLLRGFERDGFGFAPYTHSRDGGYGFSLAARPWVERELATLGGLRLLWVREAGWDGRQDVYACVRA